MKLVQRNFEVVHFAMQGTSTTGHHVADFSIGTSINKNRDFTLLGLSVIYELYLDAFNEHALEYEVRDFFVLDLEGEKANAEYLYKMVEITARDAYRQLMGEISQRGRNTLPPKPNLKK